MARKKTPDNVEETIDPTQDQTPEVAVSSEGEEGGAHLADIVVPDLDEEEIDEDAPRAVGEFEDVVDDDGLIDKRAFFAVFSAAFDLPGAIVKDFRPLAIQSDERQRARIASDAIHNLLAAYYPAALRPQGELMANLAAAAPFVLAKVIVVREIIAARRAPSVYVDDGQDSSFSVGGEVVEGEEE